MAKRTPGRRDLKFATLDQLMSDVDRLLQGHETVGTWSLAQICSHLSMAVVASVDGFPTVMPWVVRATLGRIVRKRVLVDQAIKENVLLPEKYAPKPGGDPRAEAEALRAAIRLFLAHAGPFATHPIAGDMTREEWELFHRVHAAHHLSFASPKG